MTSTVSTLELRPEQLRRRVAVDALPFQSTAEVEPLAMTIGQPRALDAIEFGLETRGRGYNLFVAGTPGSGRETTARDFVTRFAERLPTPPDWLYVHNFVEPDRPIAISLPAGRGRAFAKAMENLLQQMQKEIPRAFESEDFQRRRDALLNEVASKRAELLQELQRFAAAREFALEMTPTGIVSFPLAHGKPIPREAFDLLPEPSRKEIERRSEEVQAEVAATLRKFRQLDKEAGEQIRRLEIDVVRFATDHLFDELREQFSEHATIIAYVDQVQADIPNHLHDFWPSAPPEAPSPAAELISYQRLEHLARYQVNVLIDNSRMRGAPVVIERNPTFSNLLGRIDYRAVFGTMVTDFRQIKPGALHRANGGFLLLHILDVLRNPFAWETLKRALLCREVEIENLSEQLSVFPTARLRPAPIPLDLKVILIGPPFLYQLLYHLDEDFAELFAVRADFAPDMEWTDEHLQDYAAFISRQVRDQGLRHFDRGAVARVIEHGARLRDHQRRLSTRFLDIANLIVEASHWATKAGHELVQAEDVDQAVAKRSYRASLLEERIHDLIAERTIVIDTEGERVAQVNGLSIIDLGDYVFARPNRITARVAVGKGTIQSIEREIELSGPIHSKGFLILAGYLQGQYGRDCPLALSATLTFEQSYDEVEGDSASSTELYALLSALSDLPLKQSIAVTGAVNQHGEIQAVGGVTRKIEGFFAVCKERGLTGQQGVMIPAANVQHLMLQDEVVQAVTDGKFHIWAVHHVDEGIELLTGRPAGQRGPDGEFPAGTVHHLVQQRINHYVEQARLAAAPETATPDGRRPRSAGAETPPIDSQGRQARGRMRRSRRP